MVRSSPSALALDQFASALEQLGRDAKQQLGRDDVRLFRISKWIALVAEWSGRAILFFAASHALGFFFGALVLALYFSLEAHLNHSVTHGAYVGLSDAARMQPRTYETLGLPMQSATWRLAHKIHHVHPSVGGDDPDVEHPLFRVHATQAWRPWHALNSLLGTIFVFELWAFDYDRFLKRKGLRAPGDRGELKKLARFVGYQYVLFPVLAGQHWWRVLLATWLAVVIRNLIFVALQTGSSVGEGISTWHHDKASHTRGERYVFQIESSKNYKLGAFGTFLTGGLDRHIEHHLWPWLPPQRLRALAPKVKSLCAAHGVRYVEYSGALASFADSAQYMWRLSWPSRDISTKV